MPKKCKYYAMKRYVYKQKCAIHYTCRKYSGKHGRSFYPSKFKDDKVLKIFLTLRYKLFLFFILFKKIITCTLKSYLYTINITNLKYTKHSYNLEKKKFSLSYWENQVNKDPPLFALMCTY